MTVVVSADFFTIAKRACIDCSNVAVPACPACPSGQQCQLTSTTCEACAAPQCVAVATATTLPSSTTSSGGPNIGAIAGGIIGGLVAIAIVTYLVWRFCIKNKRQQYESEDWGVEFTEEPTAAEKDFSFRRDQRASTHTVGSIASTVLTRASNIIQIAYIPGMTSRSTPSTPGFLVPPVPPIPISLASSASSPAYTDEHFFMPGDLRDSTYSGMTDRTSYATRNSVASTIYGRNAIVSPVNPQVFTRGKAAVVSVKSGGTSTPGALTPPVPSVDHDKWGARGPPSPAFSVGSTFLNNANTALQVRPHMIRVASANRPKSDDGSDSDTEDSQRAPVRDSSAITIIDDTPTIEQGPFGDPPTPGSTHKRNGSLSAVIEEATKRAQGDVRTGLGLKREKTPFGDEHATD